MRSSSTPLPPSGRFGISEDDARYRLLTESLPQYVWTTDAEGKIDYCNRRLLEYYGLTLEEVRAGRALDYVHPEDRPILEQKTKTSHATGEAFEHEYRVRGGRGGEYRWHFVHCEPFADFEGKQRWFGIAIDVTSRKQAEFDLDDNRKLLHMVLDSAGVGTWIWNPGTNEITDLGNTAKLLGLEQIKTVDEGLNAIHPEDRAKLDWAMADANALGRLEVEYRVLLRDGAVRRIRATGSLLRNDADSARRFAGVLLDITERNRADEVRNRLAAIVDSSDDAIISKDLNGIVTSWNAGAMHLFGYRPEEMIGRSILTIIPPELQSEEPAIIASMRSGTKIDHYETVRIHKNGTRVHVSLTISPVRDAAGRIVGASKIARDIGERLRMQEAMMESEKLAATGRMAAAIAHEINNPLEAVTNLAYLLSTDPTISPAGKKYAEVLLEEINRVSDVAKQSLGFFRDNKKPDLFDICELLDSVVRLYRPLLEKKRIELKRDFTEACDVFGSAAEIRQVFANLVRNAIDAVEEGGRIQLRVRTTVLGMRRIVVADNGHGISSQTRKRLFQPFVTSKGAAGNGLGLWVSHGIVKKHGGLIRVRTCGDPGRSGTVFAVMLPSTSSQSLQNTSPASGTRLQLHQRIAS